MVLLLLSSLIFLKMSLYLKRVSSPSSSFYPLSRVIIGRSNKMLFSLFSDYLMIRSLIPWRREAIWFYSGFLIPFSIFPFIMKLSTFLSWVMTYFSRMIVLFNIDLAESSCEGLDEDVLIVCKLELRIGWREGVNWARASLRNFYMKLNLRGRIDSSAVLLLAFDCI